MKQEEKEKLYKVYLKLAGAWLELGALIGSLEREGEEVDHLRKGKEKIREGLDTVLLSVGVQKNDKRR
jgi:hypothetical protein